MAQAIARRSMIPNKYGRIVNIGSVTSVNGYAGLGPYSASRGGIKQLTMSLADDWGVHGITVNCLAPGWFRTEQNKVMYEDREWVEYLTDRIPLKRPGRPGDLDGDGRVPGLRRLGLHDRADPAGGRRHLDGRGARPAAAQGMRTSPMRQTTTARRLAGASRRRRCRLVATAATAQAPAAAPPGGAFPGQYAPPPAERKFPAWPKGCARFEGDERTACLDTVASDFGGFYRYAAANAALAAPKPSESRVVFFGDSITDNWSKPDYGGFFPGKPYVNRGIGGQTTAQMLLRFRADVVELQPKAVVILAGTNDIAGNAGPVTLDQVQDNLASMAELARSPRHPGRARVAAAGVRRQEGRERPGPDPHPPAADRDDPRAQPLARGLRREERPRLPRLLHGHGRRRRACCCRRSTTTACTRTPAATP